MKKIDLARKIYLCGVITMAIYLHQGIFGAIFIVQLGPTNKINRTISLRQAMTLDLSEHLAPAANVLHQSLFILRQHATLKF